MKDRLAICRVCLDANVQHEIEDVDLQELYERLTKIPFQTADMRPLVLCCICHAQLKASHIFMLKCLKSEEILTAVLNEVTHRDEVQKPLHIDRSALEELSYAIVPVLFENTGQNVDIEVKEESLNIYDTDVDLEEEIQELLEIASTIDLETDMKQCLPADDIPLLDTKKNTETAGEQKRVRGRKKKRKTLKKAAPIPKKPKLKLKKSRKDMINFKAESNNNNEGQISSVKDTNIPADEKFTCDKCMGTFKEKCYLITHTCKRIHPHVCSLCNQSFTAKRKLAKHSLIHTRATRHICSVCNKGFTTKRVLDIHTRTHTGEKPYVCNECDRRFVDRGLLVSHTRVHTGEKRYVCNVCSKRFRTKSGINIHARTHTGEKPYVCNVCDKRFVSHGHAVRHARTHTGEKPYVCTICDKSFIQNVSLRNHVFCMHTKH